MSLSAEIAQRFPAAVAGVSIGRLGDKSTWRVDYREGASDAAKAEVAAYLEALPDQALAQAKKAAIQSINDMAETIRLRYLTPGSGQALTYQEKFAQANAVYSMGEQAANTMSEAERLQQFPILARSVGVERDTLWECAVLVLDRYQQFNEVAGVIEVTRLTAINAIKSATTVQGVQTAHEAITWPTL
jgi:hypothetical protein